MGYAPLSVYIYIFFFKKRGGFFFTVVCILMCRRRRTPGNQTYLGGEPQRQCYQYHLAFPPNPLPLRRTIGGGLGEAEQRALQAGETLYAQLTAAAAVVPVGSLRGP